MLAVFLVSLFGLVIIGVPISFSLIGTGFCMMAVKAMAQPRFWSLFTLAQKFSNGIDSVPLLAIPFFMIAGEIMSRGGISKRIVDFCYAVLGRFKGGLGYVGVLAAMIFAGVSGSAVADTTAVGSMMLPIMGGSGYDKDKSTAIICSAGCLGPVIPPSTQMIFYAVCAGTSVSRMFLGGIIPGIIIGLGLMIAWFVHVRKRDYPIGPKSSLKEIWTATRKAIFAIFLPFFIIICITTGVATATETAALAVLYSLVVSGLIYREFNFKDWPELMITSMMGSAVMMFVVGSAQVAAYMVTTCAIPQLLASFITSLTSSKWVFMFLVNIMLVLVGCVMDSGPAIMILTPILLPIATGFGLDPVYFGVVMVTNLCIGLATPPVGNVLYCGVSIGQVKLSQLIRAIMPFVAIMFVVLFAITFIPQLILFIPQHIG
ncbi:MAG: TRAP transporter large permease [Lachnospiraceae bacterium]|nr:TRAP transporter large permease [Lachnospiraceae bacterium]